jgi:pimeloyl-[acyl-carrier protein] synthase
MSDIPGSCPHPAELRSLADIDPYAGYLAASEHGVIHWDESVRGWVVMDFEGCSAILKDDDTFVMAWSLLDGGDLALGRYGIFNLRGDAHTRMHKELLDFFNPRRNKGLQPAVRHLVRESFERLADSDSIDITRDLAQRVPGLMGLAFLGVPQDDAVLPIVHEANTRLQEYMQGFGDDPAKLEALREAHHRLAVMWSPVFEARRKSPQNDLISKLLAMQAALPDWDEEELARQALFFFGASFGNTANMIANAVYVLATSQRLQGELCEHPDRIPNFIDEVLRVWASVQFRIRITTRDTHIGGQLIRKGERVIALVAAANRDEGRFPEADEIDVERVNTRRHLTFGVGARYCVGATLARLEAEEVVRALLSGEYDVSLAPPTEPPIFAGLNYRVWEPLHLQAKQWPSY